MLLKAALPQISNPAKRTFSTALLLAAALACSPVAQAQPAHAATQSKLLPASLDAPFADPLLKSNLTLTALRVTTWNDGDAQMLLLEDDARFVLGAYGFTADAAVVRIETQSTPSGPVRHVAAFFENAHPIAGTGAVVADGPRLLVTAATHGTVRLNQPGLMRPVQGAPGHPLVAAARARLIQHRQATARTGLTVPEAARNATGLPDAVAAKRARRRARLAQEAARPDAAVVVAAHSNATPQGPATADTLSGGDTGVLPARGVVAYTMDRWSVKPGQNETAVTLAGNVQLVFEDQQAARVVTLRADKIVLFLRSEDGPPPNLLPGTESAAANSPVAGGLQAEQIAGIYLEDHAQISDGDYTVRAPKVYYDLQQRRAALLDATLSTYDRKRRIPLYMRAKEIRQLSASDFVARGATLSTSAFAVPHFSIGADELTLRRYAQSKANAANANTQDNLAPDGSGTFFTAKGTTLNTGKYPFFYWPYLAAYGLDTPLRRIGFDHSSRNGFEVTSRWDMFALLGRPQPEAMTWTADLDYLGDHGPAVGSRGSYRTPNALGDHHGYLLLDDSGEDRVAGRNVPHADDVRGYLHARHRQPMNHGYRLSLEGAYVSDPSFLETFFPGEAYAAKPFETSAHLQKQKGSTAIDLLTTTRLSDFVEQQDLLQSRGASVERYPEITHRVLGGNLLDGQVTWFSEARAGQLRLRPGHDTPADRGFTAAESLSLFGIAPNVSFNQRANALNLPTSAVRRLDLRQEVNLPMKGGPANAWNVTPYAVGRITAYDQSFDAFNGSNNDRIRLRSEVGVRMGTQFSKVMPHVKSDLLDLNGLRHLVEPQITVFAANSNLDRGDLPVYDPEVENLAEGTGLRLGLTQTWQTKRGHAQHQRTVDWITLRTNLVFHNETTPNDLLPHYDDHRPEYTVGGDHLYSELLWLVTDTLGVAGEVTHSFENDRVAQWRAGATLEHTPRLTSQLAYEEIDPLDSRLLLLGFDYTLTRKYRLGVSQTFDLGGNRNQTLAVSLDRRLPQWTLRLKADVNQLDDEQRIGISLIPNGASRDPRVF
ncbi:MAG: LPS assembly protein LptD [Algisphaera sp.]